jgi:hypothetical protein
LADFAGGRGVAAGAEIGKPNKQLVASADHLCIWVCQFGLLGRLALPLRNEPGGAAG